MGFFFELLDTITKNEKNEKNERTFTENDKLQFKALSDSQKFQFYKKIFSEDHFQRSDENSSKQI